MAAGKKGGKSDGHKASTDATKQAQVQKQGSITSFFTKPTSCHL
jgi:hypothetical protein